MPLTKSCAISPVAKTHRPAFMPCANLILPAPSSTGSSGSAARKASLLLIVPGPMDRDGALRGGGGGSLALWTRGGEGRARQTHPCASGKLMHEIARHCYARQPA